jgi:excisionase family DNA binding protein
MVVRDEEDMTMQTQLLDQREAAKLLRLSERTLERLRVQGGGPLYVKAGRAVRYRECDLDAWIAARIVSSTSAMGGGNA